jgi:hypothetical protein
MQLRQSPANSLFTQFGTPLAISVKRQGRKFAAAKKSLELLVEHDSGLTSSSE